MKCPACDREMTPVQVGAVMVDVCRGGCGGIWFDAFELAKMDERHERAGDNLVDIARDPQIRVDTNRKRACPRCAGIKLKRQLFRRGSSVEVDHCPNCAGYWLDGGELERIRTELNPTLAEAKPGQPALVSMEVIRYMYRMQVGPRA